MATINYDGYHCMRLATHRQMAADRYALLTITGPARLESLRVLRGAWVAPVVSEDDAGPAEGVDVQFVSVDSVSASEVTLADGRATLATPHGKVVCDAGRRGALCSA